MGIKKKINSHLMYTWVLVANAESVVSHNTSQTSRGLAKPRYTVHAINRVQQQHRSTSVLYFYIFNATICFSSQANLRLLLLTGYNYQKFWLAVTQKQVKNLTSTLGFGKTTYLSLVICSLMLNQPDCEHQGYFLPRLADSVSIFF